MPCRAMRRGRSTSRPCESNSTRRKPPTRRLHRNSVWGQSGFQLLDRQVGVADPHAQFPSERRQKLDRQIGMLPAELAEQRLAQAEPPEVLVRRGGGRARSAVEQRQLAKNGSGGKGDEPDIAILLAKMDTGAALGDEIER